MIWWNRLRARLKALRHRKQLDRDLEAELQFHLDMQAQAGAGQCEARRQFDNVTSLKEACRERWTLASLELWFQDGRYSARTLRLNPGFAATAVAVLALGIGSNATVFTLVNAVMFKNQPFDGSDKILYVTGTRPASGDYQGFSYPDYLDARAQSKAFASLAAFEIYGANFSDRVGFPEHYRALLISANGFAAIGQKPVVGRDFAPSDEAPGAAAAAIVSYRVWDTRYARSPSVIGKTVRINGKPTVIIGVMGPEMRFPGDTEVWTPLVPSPEYARRDNRFLTLFGTLADGESPSSAQAELSTITWRLAREYPQTNKGTGAAIRSFNQFALRNKIHSMFLAMLGAVAFVLLIACANAANLMLGRAVGRAREISVRMALGAGRWRVIRQLLMESVMLASAAGARMVHSHRRRWYVQACYRQHRAAAVARFLHGLPRPRVHLRHLHGVRNLVRPGAGPAALAPRRQCRFEGRRIPRGNRPARQFSQRLLSHGRDGAGGSAARRRRVDDPWLSGHRRAAHWSGYAQHSHHGGRPALVGVSRRARASRIFRTP